MVWDVVRREMWTKSAEAYSSVGFVSMQSTAGWAVENLWFAFVFLGLLWGVLPRWLAGFPAPGSAILHSSKEIVEK